MNAVASSHGYSMASPASKVHWEALAVLSIGVLTALVRLSIGPLTIDDAYITIRYARNVATGVGFVFNPGEHVLGTTTPLWTLILAAAYRLGAHDLPSVALVLGSLADAATSALLIQIGFRLGLGLSWSVLAAIAFAVSPTSIIYTTGGMETPLFVLLVVATGLSALTEHTALMSLFATLALLTRPEGLVLIGLIGLRYAMVRQAIPRATLAVFLTVVAPWVVFASWYFGSPVPQSMLAKALVYQTNPFGSISRWLSGIGPPNALAAFVLLPLAPRVIAFVRRNGAALLVVGFGPCLCMTYVAASLHGVFVFPWYAVPALPFLLLAEAAALRAVSRHWTTQRLVVCVAAVELLLALPGLNLGRDSSLRFFAPIGDDLSREAAYRQAAAVLAPELTRSSVIVAPEIGALGDASNARILDSAGLVSPEALRYYPLPPLKHANNAVPAALVRDRLPDAVVSLDTFIADTLERDGWFHAHYQRFATIPLMHPFYAAREVLVYIRTPTRASNTDFGLMPACCDTGRERELDVRSQALPLPD